MKHRTFSNCLEAGKCLRAAARDQDQIVGLTHGFYRYPARFSPQFAGAAIEQFTQSGDLVLDPFAGGGTAIVEALARGRAVVGNDINSLAVFVSRVKTTPLTISEIATVRTWAQESQSLRCISKLRLSDASPEFHAPQHEPSARSLYQENHSSVFGVRRFATDGVNTGVRTLCSFKGCAMGS